LNPTYRAFEAFGIELEYMIVDKRSHEIRAVADAVLGPEGDIQDGPVDWSNELVNHVIEIKNAAPTSSILDSEIHFQSSIHKILDRLDSLNCELLPGAMHFWFDPKEARLWPKGYSEVYQMYDKIFGCHGHGWANLQATHLNLPFANEDEFVRLHEAIRSVLPLLPALSASSPVVQSKLTGYCDTRLHYYSQNQRRIPQIIGPLIPESVTGIEDYRAQILAPMYNAIAPQDPQKILQHEWLNSRAAIARFERSAIEIRILDIQECVGQDIAICHFVAELVKAIFEGKIEIKSSQVSSDVLRSVFLATLKDGMDAKISEPEFLSIWGKDSAATARDLTMHLLSKLTSLVDIKQTAGRIEFLVESGNLSERIQRLLKKYGSVSAPGEEVPKKILNHVSSNLAYCLRSNSRLEVA